MNGIDIAFTYYGEKEQVGEQDNPKIVELFDLLGYDGSKLKDETAWCAAFVNATLKQAGKPHLNTLNARSLLDLGTRLSTPEFGCLVVFSRGNPTGWKGHVGYFIKESPEYIYVLGGNQNNSVCIKAYSKHRVLGYRQV